MVNKVLIVDHIVINKEAKIQMEDRKVYQKSCDGVILVAHVACIHFPDCWPSGFLGSLGVCVKYSVFCLYLHYDLRCLRKDLFGMRNII